MVQSGKGLEAVSLTCLAKTSKCSCETDHFLFHLNLIPMQVQISSLSILGQMSSVYGVCCMNVQILGILSPG